MSRLGEGLMTGKNPLSPILNALKRQSPKQPPQAAAQAQREDVPEASPGPVAPAGAAGGRWRGAGEGQMPAPPARGPRCYPVQRGCSASSGRPADHRPPKPQSHPPPGRGVPRGPCPSPSRGPPTCTARRSPPQPSPSPQPQPPAQPSPVRRWGRGRRSRRRQRRRRRCWDGWGRMRARHHREQAVRGIPAGALVHSFF
jgi:hypothetical protein